MTVDGHRASGLAYPRLVPASLLPPEDPNAAKPTRTMRDWIVDVLVFVISAGMAVVFFYGSTQYRIHAFGAATLWLDAAAGALATIALWWRRRWPVQTALGISVLSVIASSAAPASVVSVFTVAVHRRTKVAAAVAVANFAAGAVYALLRPDSYPYWLSQIINAAAVVIAFAWGMFVRARRQLVWTLRARAERAEAEQRMQADRARAAERTRIAREMHDVLAHRISLLALHAGGLELRPDRPADEISATAQLLRSTAALALEELRGVIGVLRDEAGGQPPSAPQPTLRDIARLIDETRRAGAKIEYRMSVPDDTDPPRTLGRDAYRVVQEALTNVAKHARGTATVVTVRGARGGELDVDVRNRLPVRASASTLPGSGSGLLGLGERVRLAGGTFTHGPNAQGEFVVHAQLAWPDSSVAPPASAAPKPATSATPSPTPTR